MYVCARVGRNNTPELRAQNKVTKVVATRKRADSTRYKYLQNNVCMCKAKCQAPKMNLIPERQTRGQTQSDPMKASTQAGGGLRGKVPKGIASNAKPWEHSDKERNCYSGRNRTNSEPNCNARTQDLNLLTKVSGSGPRVSVPKGSETQ